MTIIILLASNKYVTIGVYYREAWPLDKKITFGQMNNTVKWQLQYS